MQNDGNNTGCPCTVCASQGKGKIPNITPSMYCNGLESALNSSTLKGVGQSLPLRNNLQTERDASMARHAETPEVKRRVGRPPKWTPVTKVDDEGNPDVYRILIDKLQEQKSIDEPVKEPMSMDWRAERSLLPPMLDRYVRQPAWIPRVGEIVLFIKTIGASQRVSYDDKSRQYRIYDSDEAGFTEFPRWEAGIVGQVASESLRLDDLVSETDKSHNVIYSGFRVEAFPDPNSNEKPDSKRYKYVPLHHLRPFVFWQEYLRDIPEKLWHPTLRHAMTVSSTVSLLEKYRFKGSWPKAELLCKGLYLGSELILVGDAVRLMPKDGNGPVEDVLKITSIKLIFSNLDKSSRSDDDEGHPYNTAIHVYGQGFTTNPDRATNVTVDGEATLPSMSGYESLLPMHHPRQRLRIPFNRVLGRCFEAEAMSQWFPASDTKARLNAGAEGMRHARVYSSKTYLRIDQGRTWFWADTRAEAMDLESLNAQEVGRYDKSRDPYRWRACIEIIDGLVEQQKLQSDSSSMAKDLARPGRPLLGYNSMRNNLVRSALQAAADTETEIGGQGVISGEASAMNAGNANSGIKRTLVHSIERGYDYDQKGAGGDGVVISDDSDEDPDSSKGASERQNRDPNKDVNQLQAADTQTRSASQTPKKQRVAIVID